MREEAVNGAWRTNTAELQRRLSFRPFWMLIGVQF